MTEYVEGKVYAPGEHYECAFSECDDCGMPRTVRHTLVRRSPDVSMFTYRENLRSSAEWRMEVVCPVHGVVVETTSYGGSTLTVEEKERR